MTTACLLLLCSLHAAADDSLNNLSFLDGYIQPRGTVHIIVRNDASLPLTLHPREIICAADFTPLPLWWIHATPEELAPGACGTIAFSMMRPADLQGPYQCGFVEGNWKFDLKTGDSSALLAVAHMVTDPGYNDLFAFLQNGAPQAIDLSAMRVNGVPIELAPESKGRTVPPGGTAMVCGSLPSGQPPSGPVSSVVAQLDTSVGTIYRHAFLFRGPIFALGAEESEGAVFQCPTHRHGAWDTVGGALFSHAGNETSVIPTVHFCRNRFPEGLAAFGQCLPRALVNLQSADLERGTPGAWEGLNTLAPYIATAVQPGVFAAILEPNSLAEGSYMQPPDKSAPTIPARELKHLACLAIANGAKGILFRLGESPHPDFKAMADALTVDLGRITPLLGISAPVTLPISCSDSAVSVATLACGRNTFLAVLARTNLATPKDPAPLNLSVTLPPGFAADNWMEVGGSWKTVALAPPSSTVAIALDSFEDDALLLIARK